MRPWSQRAQLRVGRHRSWRRDHAAAPRGRLALYALGALGMTVLGAVAMASVMTPARARPTTLRHPERRSARCTTWAPMAARTSSGCACSPRPGRRHRDLRARPARRPLRRDPLRRQAPLRAPPEVSHTTAGTEAPDLEIVVRDATSPYRVEVGHLERHRHVHHDRVRHRRRHAARRRSVRRTRVPLHPREERPAQLGRLRRRGRRLRRPLTSVPRSSRRSERGEREERRAERGQRDREVVVDAAREELGQRPAIGCPRRRPRGVAPRPISGWK